MKFRNALRILSLFQFGFLFVVANTAAQSIAYRQTNLASNLPAAANNIAPSLVDPWGIAFLSGQPFFIADNNVGRITTHDGSGIGVRPGSFIVPNAAGTGFDRPNGIVADPNSSFGSRSLIAPFILVTGEGTVFIWGPNAQGDLPQFATQVIDRSARGAVYKSVAILNSPLSQPALAVADFHGGFIDTFLPGFLPVALAGSFTDPDLPAGYAPFGIQVIGSQVFVTYAVQDAAKHDPVAGAGNGIVNIFDQDGNFIRRFATGGALNAPWGVAKASANFGPLSNDILIGSVGDGTISAFDQASGQFVGQLLNGDGNPFTEVGLHALAFRADGFGDANSLYFTSQFSGEGDGLFGAITTGLLSAIRITTPAPTADASVVITVEVSAGPGNPGIPTGTVKFLDGSNTLGSAPLANGSATFTATFDSVGIHAITAQYRGDAVFLPSSELIPLDVTGLATQVTLDAPAITAPGSTLTLTATATSLGGVPTGQVTFLDGRTNLGTGALNDAGVATLRTNTLAAGTHVLTASYAGDGKFDASTSAVVNIEIANADFTLAANPSASTVVAGQSTQFMLTIAPAGGFTNDVTFACSNVIGITCAFNPATVTPTRGTASTSLTVTTSASVPHYGFLMMNLAGPFLLVVSILLFGLLARRYAKFQTVRGSLLTATATTIIVALGLTIGGCGGYGNNNQTNRGTALITVTARSGAVSHTTNITVTVQ